MFTICLSSYNLDYDCKFDTRQINNRQTSTKLYKLKFIGHEKIISFGALNQRSNGKQINDGVLQN